METSKEREYGVFKVFFCICVSAIFTFIYDGKHLYITAAYGRDVYFKSRWPGWLVTEQHEYVPRSRLLN